MEPTLVYDDDCGFCTWWAELFDARSSLRVVGFSELTPELRERLPEGYEECVHLVTDDAVYSCGEAVEEALARSEPGLEPVVGFLRQFGDYERARERLYRWGADNRDLFGRFVSRPPARDSGGE
jgi:predicted DCC family thiol-disulfide oxidoreductase YuxK